MSLVDKILATRRCFNYTPKDIVEELEQVNTESGRYYKTPSGSLYPSITTVVGIMNMQAIMDWRKRVGEEEANRISQKATRRGTKVHQLCEDYIAGNHIDGSRYSITDLESFISLRKVIDEYIDNVHCQEKRLYSDYLEVAGTVDCVAEYAGRLSIIDFKTARKAKNREYIQNYFCQATAYAIMYEERTGIPVPNIVIIISVDDDVPQVFTDKRDNYVGQLLDVRKKYKELKGV